MTRQDRMRHLNKLGVTVVHEAGREGDEQPRQSGNMIGISAVPEHVYYHPLRSCTANASRDNMNIEDTVKAKLAAPNEQLLWREFGVRV